MRKPTYSGDGWNLYVGDCLAILPGLTGVDAVVTDPPYAIPTQVAACRKITRNVGDMSIVECAFMQHARAWKACVGESGRVFVFGDGSSYPVIFRAAYGSFHLASLVWDKGQIGMGREFRKRHELILHGWGADTEVVDSHGVGYADILECRPVPSEFRSHPAEKPVPLIEQILRVCGETVLDPFAGSASTGVACLRTGRKFIGIEIDEHYAAIAAKRLQRAEADVRNSLPFPEPEPMPKQAELWGGVADA